MGEEAALSRHQTASAAVGHQTGQNDHETPAQAGQPRPRAAVDERCEHDRGSEITELRWRGEVGGEGGARRQ